MNISRQFDATGVQWARVPQILEAVGMAFHTPEMHQKAFENSYATVYIFDNEELIGFGRAISDGVYQAAIYDVAVLPTYQGKGIGRMIMHGIFEQCPTCNFILYASPGKEAFYAKENFGKLKTGMGLFKNMERMRHNGMIE